MQEHTHIPVISESLWLYLSVWIFVFSHCTSQHLFDLLAGLGSGELVNNIQRCLTECVPHPSTDTTLKRKARIHIHMVQSYYTDNTDMHTFTWRSLTYQQTPKHNQCSYQTHTSLENIGFNSSILMSSKKFYHSWALRLKAHVAYWFTEKRRLVQCMMIWATQWPALFVITMQRGKNPLWQWQNRLHHCSEVGDRKDLFKLIFSSARMHWID